MGRTTRTLLNILAWIFLIYNGLKKDPTAADVISTVIFGVIILTNRLEDMHQDLEEDITNFKNKNRNEND